MSGGDWENDTMKKMQEDSIGNRGCGGGHGYASHCDIHQRGVPRGVQAAPPMPMIHPGL